MISGIYKIINKVNGKFYLGSSKDIDKRWERHLYQLRSNRHHSIHLQRAWTKYGESNFSFEVMQILPSDIDQKQLFNQEKKLLDELMPWDDSIGYNMSRSTDGGDLISYHPNIKDIREKQKNYQKDKWDRLSEEEKLEYAEKMKGEGNPNWRGGKSIFICPICQNKCKKQYGLQETCASCRDRSKNNNPFYGRKHSEKTLEKLRNKHLSYSPEVINKLKENMRKMVRAKAMKFTIHGKYYEVIRDAVTELGIHSNTIRYRLKHPESFPDYIIIKQQSP